MNRPQSAFVCVSLLLPCVSGCQGLDKEATSDAPAINVAAPSNIVTGGGSDWIGPYFIVNGEWMNPTFDGPDGTIRGLGTSFIRWGIPFGEDGGTSGLRWKTVPQTECPIFEVPATLGRLAYVNGTIALGSGITGAELFMTSSSDDELCDGRSGLGTMATVSTPNAFSPREDPRNADFVWFQVAPGLPFKKYFHVNEGGTAEATVAAALSVLGREARHEEPEIVILGFVDVEGDGFLTDTVLPLADAGPNQFVRCLDKSGAQVRLNGSRSIDYDGNELTYTWTGPFPEGGGIAHGVSPTVTMPVGDSVVYLAVNDGQDGDSTADPVLIRVRCGSEADMPFEPTIARDVTMGS